MQVVARMLGVTRQSVGKWVSDITERRREVRRLKAILLSRVGWTQQRIAEALETSQQTITNDVNADISGNDLTEDLLRDALEDLPEECAEVAEEIREEWMFAARIVGLETRSVWAGGRDHLLRPPQAVLQGRGDGPRLRAFVAGA